jgi:hypothetical protein
MKSKQNLISNLSAKLLASSQLNLRASMEHMKIGNIKAAGRSMELAYTQAVKARILSEKGNGGPK